MRRNGRITSTNLDDVLNQLIVETNGNGNRNDENIFMQDNSDEYTMAPGISQENNQNNQIVDPIQNPELNSENVPESIENKLNTMSLNNGWNDKNERILISIGENAASYKWMHERSSSFYLTINKALSMIMILFTTGLSAETLIPSNNNNLALDIVRRIFTYLVTVLSVIQNFLKYEQLSEQHINAASSFSQLYHEIQQQMCMYRKDRNNATKYMAEILKRYDTLVVNGPQINNIIVNQFKNAFKNADISIPDIADRIQKIEIISEPVGIRNINVGGNDTVSIPMPAAKSTKAKSVCNLQQIHNAFQIQGDISDHDVKQRDIEMQELRKKFLREKSNYEYTRYLQHAQEHE